MPLWATAPVKFGLCGAGMKFFMPICGTGDLGAGWPPYGNVVCLGGGIEFEMEPDLPPKEMVWSTWAGNCVLGNIWRGWSGTPNPNGGGRRPGGGSCVAPAWLFGPEIPWL